MRSLVFIFVVAALGTAMVAPSSSADCHLTPPGCVECPTNSIALDIECRAPDFASAPGDSWGAHVIGTIAGLVVSGQAGWSEGAAYIDLTFEPTDPPYVPANVTLHVIFGSQSEVAWRTPGFDHTFNATTNATTALRYHPVVNDGRHVHFSLAITAHEGSDREERLEGELELHADEARGFTDVWEEDWVWLLGSVAVGLVLGLVVGRRSR